MPDLKPVTALGGKAARSFSAGALSIDENDGLALASVALRRGAAQPAPFGLTLPEPGKWTEGGGVSAFWIGPDQWMIERHDGAHNDFAKEVSELCPGASVTEQTDGFAAFEIRSAGGEPAILALMAKLVNLDPAHFNPGSATRTGLHHMSVFVIRRAPDRLAILCMRSAAGTLWHALEAAASRLGAEREQFEIAH